MTISRRDLLKRSAYSCLAAYCAPLTSRLLRHAPIGRSDSTRCINVVNFIRGDEPRAPIDLLLPVQKQMGLILQHKLPATWLLQYDALVTGDFVGFLKQHMAGNHEVGFWFEMNEKLCDAAGVNWRGCLGFEWDSQPPVAFTIGYTPAERILLADAAMRKFESTFGHLPGAVASWNLDSISIAHLSEKYGVDAFAVCRDQIATDGFTIWGAPIAGYYPSKVNSWSPALSVHNQIQTPVFRMLGQDPVYYYLNQYPSEDGTIIDHPDTMEPVWDSGRSSVFVHHYLEMISAEPCLEFAYLQMGQENNFGWPSMEPGYPMQMAALSKVRHAGTVHVETLGETGRRFKKAFRATPAQAQVQLKDPFDHTDPAERTVWYQSRFYRANLHFIGDSFFLRDVTVYSDRFPQPFLNAPTRDQDVEQRMPAVLDGYHWSSHPGSKSVTDAGGFFNAGDELLHLNGEPRVIEEETSLIVELSVSDGGNLHVRFDEKDLTLELNSKSRAPLSVSFQWDPTKAALASVAPRTVGYRWQNFEYFVAVERGQAKATAVGWTVTQDKGGIRLGLAQSS